MGDSKGVFCLWGGGEGVNSHRLLSFFDVTSNVETG